MRFTTLAGLTLFAVFAIPSLAIAADAPPATSSLTFSCKPENDLYRAITAGGTKAKRFDSPAAAIDAAVEGAGVLLLADAASSTRTVVSPDALALARQKKLRLFIERPQSLPGYEFGEPQTATWERVVVASDAFADRDALPRLRILSAHACTFTPVKNVADPLLVIGRVAGYDTAVYGLAKESHPLLFRTADGDWVATTNLSHFVTARFAPTDLWAKAWQHVLGELSQSNPAPRLVVEPTVSSTFSKSAELPKGVERDALARFAAWVHGSGLLVPAEQEAKIHKLLVVNTESMPPAAADEPVGDGSRGVLEGYASHILPDGKQSRRTPLRADCQAETAMALAVHSLLSGDKRSHAVATNLLDYTYVTSNLHQGVRGDPNHPAFGLIAWGSISPAWEVATYGDDNARTLLGTMLAAACLKSDAWDEAMLKGLYANLRTTGKLGFRGDRIDIPALEQHGWRHFQNAETVNYALNFEAYSWACFLWAYHHTGDPAFLEKTRTALRMTMAAYPKSWRWADNMERARILLPLAWLVRVDDTPEHRGWLKQVATDLLKNQDETGAIRESLGGEGKGAGHYVVPATNEAYGTTETPLIQANGNPVADQLYTTGFALIGLHEAAAVMNDPDLRAAEDKLAAFLVRIQSKSTTLPALDGVWFRAFDFGQWDYWASSADIGWGAWCVEAGWGPTWIAATLGLRDRNTSLWEITSGSKIKRHVEKVKPMMEK